METAFFSASLQQVHRLLESLLYRVLQLFSNFHCCQKIRWNLVVCCLGCFSYRWNCSFFCRCIKFKLKSTNSTEV